MTEDLKPANLKARILAPLATAIALLLVVFIAAVYWYQQRDIAEHAEELEENVKTLFAVELEREAESLGALLEALSMDGRLRTALAEKNREALLEYSAPLFERLRTRYEITHLYFTGPDRVNILRVHQPDRHGDRIDRITTLEAEKTGRPFHGIELGPLGTFTLRAVVPWYQEKRLLGYVELGKEIGHVMHKLHDTLGAQFIVEIDKKFLDREAWEAGMRMLGRTSTWDASPLPVTTYYSQGISPLAIGPILSQVDRAKRENQKISFGGHQYLGSFLPLSDAGKRQVGEMLVMLEVSNRLADANRAVLVVGAVCLAVGATLILLFYVLSNRTERQIKASHLKLIEQDRAREALRLQHIQDLEHLALYDPLTDLPNRALLLDRLQNLIAASFRDGKVFTLVLINLDHLRDINESLGHQNGDLMLKQVGQRLTNGFRDSDTIARLGGGEFAMLLPLSGTEHGEDVAHKIHEILEPPFVIDDLPLLIEGSVGMAVYPEHGEDAKSLLQKAGIALRTAKSTKSGFSVYDAKEDSHSLQRLTLMSELRQAIAQDQLMLVYQPKVCMKTRLAEGVEALVRWRHPERGMVSPAEFIPLAEQTGLIKPLTHWVLNEALRQCRAWSDMGRDITVAVNLSARNLIDPQLPDQVSRLIETWKVNPVRLILEITETAIMAKPERATEILSCLKEMGIGLSIDDFGTGYTSLGYLKKLPVTEFKIDRSFVAGATANNDDVIIMRNTIALGKNLGLEIVAEGVESRETWELLESLGCDRAQGYYMSRPLPADHLMEWLDQWGPGKNVVFDSLTRAASQTCE